MDIRPIKRLTRRLGLFDLSRFLYRKTNPRMILERRNDWQLFSSLIGKGDLVYDIGANMGEKSDIFLRLGAKVVAVEPNPNCTEYLRRKFKSSRHFDVIQAAVGGESGTGILNFSGTDKTASLRKDWFSLNRSEGPLQEIEVQIVTLKDLIDSHGMPDYCKVDVEGFEAAVLQGLDQQIPLLSFEFHMNALDELTNCVNILQELGPWHFNLIRMNGHEFIFPKWIDDSSLLSEAFLRNLPDRGDIFARPVSRSQ